MYNKKSGNKYDALHYKKSRVYFWGKTPSADRGLIKKLGSQ